MDPESESLVSPMTNEIHQKNEGILGITKNPYWNICLLALAWSWTLTTSTLLTTIGPLSARELGASKSLSAFTIGVFLFGAAVSSYPSSLLFRTLGRFKGFSVGCLAQMAGSVLGALALHFNSQALLYLGCFSVGIGQGLGQFYRFSAVEGAPADLKSSAITYVLSGGIIAAFLGPTSANETVGFLGRDYIGSFATMGLIGLVNELTIMLVNFVPLPSEKPAMASPLLAPAPRRSLIQICSQPLFVISCAVATLAHTIMVMLMSNVTLSMTQEGFGFSDCSLVMELHFLAMFGPGFITGRMIRKRGSFVVALLGALITASSVVVFVIGHSLWNYILGMMLLGIGWNFSFSSGTVMLTSSYRPAEATDAQAINDAILFTVAGAGSLISGVIFSHYGWLVLIYTSAGLIGLDFLLFLGAWELRHQVDQVYEEEEKVFSPMPLSPGLEENILPEHRHDFGLYGRSQSTNRESFTRKSSFSTAELFQPQEDVDESSVGLRTQSVA